MASNWPATFSCQLFLPQCAPILERIPTLRLVELGTPQSTIFLPFPKNANGKACLVADHRWPRGLFVLFGPKYIHWKWKCIELSPRPKAEAKFSEKYSSWSPKPIFPCFELPLFEQKASQVSVIFLSCFLMNFRGAFCRAYFFRKNSTKSHFL